MKSKKTPFTVGLFLIIGLAVSITAIIWFGMSNYFDTGKRFVAYFDESVQGLAKDSPVKYRGVTIGRVEQVRVAEDGILIEVLMSIEADRKPGIDLVAQLKSIGITGIMFVELDQRAKQEKTLTPKLDFKPRYPVIPTRPSDIKRFIEGLAEVLEMTTKLDTEGISKKVKESLDSFNKAVEDLELQALSTQLQASLKGVEVILAEERWDNILDTVQATLNSIESLSDNADKGVSEIRGNILFLTKKTEVGISHLNSAFSTLDKMVAEKREDLDKVVEQTRKTIRDADRLMNTSSVFIQNTDDRFHALQSHLLVTLMNLEKASENLNLLLEKVSDEPSALFFGEPAPVREADMMEGR